jgi:hypothetical protein
MKVVDTTAAVAPETRSIDIAADAVQATAVLGGSTGSTDTELQVAPPSADDDTTVS